MDNIQIPLLLITAGKSGSGKTTVLERLIPELNCPRKTYPGAEKKKIEDRDDQTSSFRF